MNTLTKEDIIKIQAFTPEQKTLYNQTRGAGIPAQDALDIVLKTETNKNIPTPTGDGIVFGQESLASGIVEGVKEAVTGGVKEIADQSKENGIIPALLRAPLSLAAGAGRGVGDIFGSILETADDLTGEIASDALQPVIEQAVVSETGQKILQGLDKFDQSTQGVAGDLLDTANLLGLSVLKSAPAKAMRESIKTNVKEGVARIVGGTPPGGSGGSTLGQNLKDLLKKPLSVLNEKPKVPEAVISPATFKEALEVGFQPQEARLFSNLSEVDKGITNKMLKLSEDISNGVVDATTRPIDFVGKNVKTRLESLTKIERELGKGVDDAAKSLEKLPIDQNTLNEGFLKTVSDYNIKRTNKGWDFSDSDFALTKSVQKDIEEALNYVFSPKKDGYSVHRIKKTLDGILYPQKTMEGLSGKAKSLIQQLRRDADGYLDNNFEVYKIANDSYSEVRNVLDGARDTLGAFDDANLAQRIRQTFSNSGKREEFKTILKQIDDLAKSKGLEDIGNIYNQALFSEKLIDLFGDKAVTGFGESIQRAVSRATAIAQGLKNPIQGVGKLAGDIIEKVAGQTPENRLEFLKKLLNYENK
jgi:hypothetical protein